MNSRPEFDGLLGDWLKEKAMPRVPDYVDEALARTARTRQRRAWSSPWRWLPVENVMRVPYVPRTGLIVAAALLILAAIATLVLGVGAPRRLPPPFGVAGAGLITYDRTGGIYVAAADGTGARPFVASPGPAFNPSWSRDGTHLAYWSQVVANGLASLVVVDEHGANPTTIVPPVALAQDPSDAEITWSPDGRTVAYAAAVARGSRIFIASLDGSAPIQIGDPSMAALTPAWSPDGRTIAFKGGIDGVYLMGADGSSPHRVSTLPGSGYAFAVPQWSPDGRTLLYYVGADGGHTIVRLDVASGKETPLPPAPPVFGVDEFWPSWSPDGTLIAYLRGFSATVYGAHLMVMDADGTNQRSVAPDLLLSQGQFVWSPDGRSIYQYSPDGLELIVIDPAGVRPPVHIPMIGNIGLGSWQRIATP